MSAGSLTTPLIRPLRRNTVNREDAVEKRMIQQFFTLNSLEFTERQRYRDTNGNVYAPARTSDPIYKTLLSRRVIDPLAEDASGRGLPPALPDARVVDKRGTQGKLHGRVLLYARTPRNNKINPVPTGQISFVDPETNELFTGSVEKSLFIGRAKSGYVVLQQVVSWGALSDPSEFPRGTRSNSAKRKRDDAT